MPLRWRLSILFTILILAYCWKSSQLIIAPKRFVSPYTPVDFGLHYKPLKIKTQDNITLDAWLIPAKNCPQSAPTIIICHGFGLDKGDCIPIARFLHHAHYNLLMFDFRAHGKSQGRYSSLGYYEQKDLESVVNYLSHQGHQKIGAIGFSMGATTTLLLAAKNKKINAVVSDGAFLSFQSAVSSFAKKYFKAPKYPFIPPAIWTAAIRLKFNPYKLNLLPFMPKISPTPIFIIHGSLDREISLKDAIAIFNSANQPKKLWIVPHAHHLQTYSIAKQEYEQKIISFFNSSLKP